MRYPAMRPLVWLVLLLALAACDSFADSATSADVLLQESFAPASIGPWLLEGDDWGRTAVINEELIISINAPNTLQYAMLAEPTFSDFQLEVDAKQIAGSPESSFGLLARMQESGEFYRFSITGSGLYMVERRAANGAWTQYLPDWTDSAAINQGLSAANRLKLVADGAKFSFYVNDTLLHQLDDALFLDGNIALDAGTFGQAGLQVSFDNLVVRELK
jgi:hypothetical protein